MDEQPPKKLNVPPDPDPDEKGEISFDPHSVVTAQTIEEQKQTEEMRKLLAKGGIISPETAQSFDVDISGVRTPQYARRAEMQKDMDKRVAPETSPIAPALEAVIAVPKEVPPELKEIYGDHVPLEKVTLFNKLKGKSKREGYLKVLRDSEEEKRKRTKERPETNLDERTDLSGKLKAFAAFRDVVDAEERLGIRPGNASKEVEVTPAPAPTLEQEQARVEAFKKSEQEAEAKAARERDSEDATIEFNPKAIREAQKLEEAAQATATAAEVETPIPVLEEVVAIKEPKIKAKEAEVSPIYSTIKIPPTPDNLYFSIPVPSPEHDPLNPFRRKLGRMEDKFRVLREKYPDVTKMPEDVAVVFNTFYDLNEKMGEGLRSEKVDVAALEKTGAEIDAFVEQYFPEVPRPTSVPEDEMPPTFADRLLDNSSDSLELWQNKLGEVIEKENRPTPAESHSILGKLIDGYKKTLEATKEKFDWYKSSSEKLIRRNEELDAKGEKIGGFDGERLFRKMGEKYNKLPFWSKLVLGGTLGVGAVVGASASVPLAFTCMSGIAAQRLAGFATMYMKFEKNSHEEKWGKEKAMLKAGVYTALLGLTMKEAVEYLSDTSGAHWAQAKIEGWIGDMRGYFSEAPPQWPHEGHPLNDTQGLAHQGTPQPMAPDRGVPTAAPDFKAAAPEAPGPAGETVAVPAAEAEIASQSLTEPPGAIPEISVEVKAGRGYEDMAWRLWKELQDKGLKPEDFPDENSDIRQLLDADPSSIKDVVHDIARQHGMYQEDGGANVRIDLGSHMTIGSDGELHVIDAAGNDIVNAPEGANVTAPYNPEAVAATAEAAAKHAEGVTTTVIPDTFQPDQPFISPTGEESTGPTEVGLQQPTEPSAIDLTAAQEANLNVSETSPTGEVVSHAYENSFGTLVDPDVAHGYLSEKGLYVFGGSGDLDALAQEYALKNHMSVFVDKSSTNWLGWTSHKVIEYVPAENDEITMVIHNGPSLVPDPKDFTKRVF